jgi:hypothetical protein
VFDPSSIPVIFFSNRTSIFCCHDHLATVRVERIESIRNVSCVGCLRPKIRKRRVGNNASRASDYPFQRPVYNIHLIFRKCLEKNERSDVYDGGNKNQKEDALLLKKKNA